MLFRSGDSHAAQWFPALYELAQAKKITLTSATKSSCPLTANTIYASGRANISCDKWHINILDLINNNNFDYIVFSAFDRNNYDIKGKDWGIGVAKFIDQIASKGQIVQLIDTPKPSGDSVACLSIYQKSPQKCDFAPQNPIKIVNPKIKYIDPNPWLCPNKCIAVTNGVNTYRDGSHISVTTAKKLAGKIEKALFS